MSSHKTAISRNVASSPAIWLDRQGRLTGRLLDFGCGRGKDVERFGMTGYDPFWAPEEPVGKFDTICCTFVLNVVDKSEQDAIISRVRNLLTDTGVAYFSVRRDIPKNALGYTTGSGTFQRWVELDLPCIREISSRYAIYELRA